MKFITILISFFICHSLYAQTVLTCIEEKSTVIQWQESSFFKKAGLSATATNSPGKPPSNLSFIVDKKRGILKGNVGQVDLTKVNENVFLEENAIGDIFMWTLIPAKKSTTDTTYLIQHKAYADSMGMFTITVVYKCQ